MLVLISLPLAILPAIILVWYYYKKDRQKPEPKGLIIKIFFLGILSTLPACIIELILQQFEGFMSSLPLLTAFFRAFVIAALCEELIKLIVVKKFTYNRVEFDEVMDGIVYTVVASLGFACMENIIYVMSNDLTIALIRAFTAVPMHAFASGIMGYYIGKAKFSEEKESSLIRKGLIIAILIHGFYDFLIFSMPTSIRYLGSDLGVIPALGVFPLLIVIFFVLKKNIKSAISEDIKKGRSSD